MSRIEALPLEGAPGASQDLLEGVRKQLGTVPNMFRTFAHSPAALEGYLGLSSALARGSLDAATRERIALAVAEINGCGYCLAAHSYLGKNHAKLSESEIESNRRATSADAKAAVAVAFAARVVETRGQVGFPDIQAVRTAGFHDAEIVEIVAHVALNTLTNYLNKVAETAIDFPAAPALKAA